ncbi:MAG: 2-oxo acid dehydrogenase subunit E2, partial [Proteobacteria bacterium]|nr:2-oxo acid dehydrogenase subunit E2 [Pseudomonadota bacterium]
MSRYVFKVPDLGEGTVSSEIVAWRAKVGDLVREDEPLVEMSTEKAVVEVPAPVSGRIVALNGGPGDVVAVGAELAVFETEAAAPARAAAPATDPVPAAAPAPAPAPAPAA